MSLFVSYNMVSGGVERANLGRGKWYPIVLNYNTGQFTITIMIRGIDN